MSVRRLKILIPGFAALLISSVSQAALIQSSYTNSNGEPASSSPGAQYMNPTGLISFAVSAGLDRKVRVELRHASGELIESATSPLLGASDKITVNGKDYYGARVTLSSPNEGEYVTSAQILNSDDDVVQSDEYPWTLDRSGYQFNGMPVQSQYSRYDQAKPNWEIVSGSDKMTMTASITGTGAPVKSAVLTAVAQSTGEVGTFTELTVSDTSVGALLPRDKTLWPVSEDYYAMDLAVTDAAGNVTHKQWNTRFDNSSDPYTVIGITYAGKDRTHPWANIDGLEEFTPYVENMKVDTYNPRLLVKADSNQVWPVSDFGLYGKGYCMATDNNFCLNREVHHEADGESYLITNPVTLRRYDPDKFTVRGSDLADNNSMSSVVIAAKDGLALRPQFKIPSVKFADGVVINGDAGKLNAQRDSRYDEIRLELSRPYAFPVEITDSWNDSITIPAGQTKATLKTSNRYTRYLKLVACPSGNKSVCQVEYTSFSRDNTPPKLLGWSYETGNLGQYRVEIREKYSTTSGGLFGLRSGTLIATDDNGESHEIGTSSFDGQAGLYTLIFPMESLSSGRYAITLHAIDNFGNTSTWSLESRSYDGQVPTIELNAYGKPLGVEPLKTLGDITISVSDDSAGVVPGTVQLVGGPANDTISLAWTKKPDGRFALEYPIMFPSIEEGDYRITATVVDPTGNMGSVTNAFTYEPIRISMAPDSQGVVTIPALTHAFTRKSGGELIHTEPFTLYDGSVLQGTYDVYATVRSDATIALLINGVRVEPGQTLSVVGAHDFSGSGGSLNIPLSAADADVAGSADVLVSTSAPGAAVVSTRIRTWKSGVDLETANWTVKQAIDEVAIDAKADTGTYCELTANKTEAQRASVLDAPVCFLEWDSLPLGTIPAKDAPGQGEGPGVRGRAYQQGDQQIKYSVWVYDYEGNPYLLQQSSRVLTVDDPDGVIGFSTDKDVSEVYYAVEALDVSLEQSSGPECMTTISADQAERSAGSRRLTCLIEWITVPDGLAQLTFRDRPQLRGHADQKGPNALSWRVSAFSSTGQKIVLNEQTVNIEATDPPAPEIVIDDDNLIEGDMYAAPLEGGYIGDARITSYNAALDVDVTRAGEMIDSMTSPGGWGDNNVVQRRINSDARPLWSQTEYGVSARYDLIDESVVSKKLTALAVPSLNVAPVIEADGDTVLNTEPLTVQARIDDPFDKGGYNADTMGIWQVRIVNLHGRDVMPISDYQDTSASGSKTFTLDLDKIDDTRMRLAAQARLVSPVDGYERTVLSSRPIYMTVLRGQPIDSTIDGRRISGEAPLTAVMTLKIDNRLDRAALGDVEWQVSADKENWSPLENTARYETRFIHRFERGNYFVRAIVNNKNSGAVFKTPTVAISAYLLPPIAVSGPENAFIGAVADYAVSPDESNTNYDPNTPLVYQWSTDRGEVWVDGDASFHISRAEEARLPVWVRARYETAPADDDYAWTRERTRISFRKVRAPRVRIIGPRLIETGKPREFRATVRAPYRKMNVEIKGVWTLPDDSHSEGSDELTYTANDSDLAKERVSLGYTAWIVGYKDQEAVDTDNLSLRIWQYEWPEFEITTREGSEYAPTDLVARIRSLGTARYRDLDQPEIEWSVPEGLAAVGEARSTVRSFETSQPGEYILRATITDARGHTADVSKTIVLKPAPPYEFDFRYTASNRYDRAPMDIRVRPYISGGHPRDRIESYSYSLDGQPVETQSRFGEMTIAEAGEHRVGLQIKTQMGNTADGQMALTAKENKSPTCAINARSATTYWRFYARCEDPDGRMARYSWTLNGETVGTSSYQITVRNDGEGAPTVKVIGEDDSGAVSPPATWHGDP